MATNSHGRQNWVELKLPVEPTFLLHREVTVRWDGGAWYKGVVKNYNELSFEHKVVYDDGDQEDIIIGTDIPVKVRCYSNECLPTPSAQQLERLSSLLLQQAENDDAAAKAASGPSERRKKHAAADRKRLHAQRLLELADAAAAEEVPAAATDIADHTQPQPHCTSVQQPGGVIGHGTEAAAGLVSGVLSDFLTAAQQLLQDIHPANVPGLGFSKVQWPWQMIGPNMSLVVAQRRLDQSRQQQQQQQHEDAVMGSDLLCLAQELASALETHQQTRHEHSTYYKELDVSLRVSPEGLVGRDVRVYWVLDDAWFLGAVKSYDPDTARHEVVYRDGTVDHHWMGTERVRLLYYPGEQLPQPDADTLAQLAQTYMQQAQQLEDQLQQLQSGARPAVDASLDAEDVERPSLLRSKAQVLLAAASMKQQGLAPDVWVPTAAVAKLKASSGGAAKRSAGRSSKARSSSNTSSVEAGATTEQPQAVKAAVMEVSDCLPDVAEQAEQGCEQASGWQQKQLRFNSNSLHDSDHQAQQEQQLNQCRQQQPQQCIVGIKRLARFHLADGLPNAAEKDTRPSKRQKAAAEEDVTHTISALARCRAGAVSGVVDPADQDGKTPVQATGTTDCTGSVLKVIQQQVVLDCSQDLSKLEHKDKKTICSSSQQVEAQQLQQQPDMIVVQPTGQQGTAGHDTGSKQQPSVSGHQTAVDSNVIEHHSMQAAGGNSSGSSSGSSSSCRSVEISVELGELVWVQTRGNPAWPAIVISSEEATDFSIPLKMAKQAQVCVQYFGDYARARVHPSNLVPVCVALEQYVWIPTLLKKTHQRLVDNFRLALREFIEYCKTGQLPDPEMVPEHNDERWFDFDDGDDDHTAADTEDVIAASSSSSSVQVSNNKTSQPRPGAIDHVQGVKVFTLGKHITAKLGQLGSISSKAGSLGGGSSAAADRVVEELRHWAAQLVVAQGDAASQQPSNKARLPLQLSPNLILMSLGRIDFVHPGYHNEKYIYPVGFSVRRKVKSPASAGRELWHLCEILEHPDGSGPIFRISPDGCKSASGSSPAAAWEGLYDNLPAVTAGDNAEGPQANAARAASSCGIKLFGLQHTAIQLLIQALPQAAACDRFMAWKGPRPPPVRLTSEQQLAKRAVATRLLSLPPGITPLPLTRRMVSACDACGDEIEVEGNLLVECDKCRVVVHMRCYGLSKPPDGSSWLCDVCRLPGVTSPPPCSLCPRLGGAMKVTAEGGWCHLVCATWLPGMFVADHRTMEPIMGRVHKDHRSLLCSICQQPYGACIQCAGSSKCYAAFHPTCARDAGYPMVAAYDEDSDSETDTPATAAGAPATGTRSFLEPSQAAVGSGEVGIQQQQRGMNSRGKGPKQRGRSKKLRKEGTAAGDNTRLLCFCPKHRLKAAGMERSLMFETSIDPTAAVASTAVHTGAVCSGAAGGSSAAATASFAAGSGQRATSFSSTASVVCSAGTSLAPSAAAPSKEVSRTASRLSEAAVTLGTCARSRPADTAIRRGLRAPDALAAALRKRQYVMALPYLVTSSTQAQQLLPPPVPRARCTGPEFDWDVGHHKQQLAEQHSSQTRAVQEPRAVVEAQRSQLLQEARTALTQSFAGQASSLDLPCVGLGSGNMQHMSLAERYQLMTATVLRRICSGKSAIHGLGVFAKVPHRAGDMIVEYIGHLVRPRVADILEARTYNQLVGAGTYVFRLNDHFLVDATRAGNIAHLINHSCAPCCVSKAYTIQCPQTGERKDHVVIVAKRDIAVGEELTYDYRFAGDEKLRCNCGASTCRGWVNMPSSFDSPLKRNDGALLVPSHELVPVKDAEQLLSSTASVPTVLF